MLLGVGIGLTPFTPSVEDIDNMTLIATFFIGTEINLVILIATIYLLTEVPPRTRHTWQSIHDMDTRVLPAVIRTERYVPGERCLPYWREYKTDQMPAVRV